MVIIEINKVIVMEFQRDKGYSPQTRYLPFNTPVLPFTQPSPAIGDLPVLVSACTDWMYSLGSSATRSLGRSLTSSPA